jgi:hypothetical protein
MTIEELVKFAHAEAPETVEKIAEALHELEEDPVELREVLADFQKIAARVTEKSKTAGLWKDVGAPAARTLGTSVALGLGVALATDLFSRAKRGLTAKNNWKAMLEAHPPLKENDLGRVRYYFNSLQKHAPDVAADPLGAAAAVENMVRVEGSPGIYAQTLKSQIDLQKTINDAKFKPFDRAQKITIQLPRGPGALSND